MARFIAFLLLPFALLLAGCSSDQAAGKGPVVLAAASLQESLEAVAQVWESEGHAAPVLSFAASSALARQVEQGAPADIFVSADEEWMDLLDEKGLLKPGTRADLLGNALVLIAPAASEAQLDLADPESFAAVLENGRLAIADPDTVPAGKYGKAALEKLGLWPGVRGKLAPAENVRAALALVERGEAPLGIVYATDAKASGGVRILAIFPDASHPPIRYPAAVLASSTHDDADAFRAFLASEKARGIFARHGFLPPG